MRSWLPALFVRLRTYSPPQDKDWPGPREAMDSLNREQWRLDIASQPPASVFDAHKNFRGQLPQG